MYKVVKMRLKNEKKGKMVPKFQHDINRNKKSILRKKKVTMSRGQRVPYSLSKHYFSMQQKLRLARLKRRQRQKVEYKTYNETKKVSKQNKQSNKNILSERLKNMKELSIPLIRIDELFDIPILCRRMDDNSSPVDLITFENNNSIKNKVQYEENSSDLSQKLVGNVGITNFVKEDTMLTRLKMLNENVNDDGTIQNLLISKTDEIDSQNRPNESIEKTHRKIQTDETEFDVHIKTNNERSLGETSSVSKVRENSRFKFDDPNHVLAMCDMCREVYSLIKQIKHQHVNINQGSSVKCLFCNLHFVTIIHLENHLSRTHLKCIKNSGKNDNFPIQIVNPEDLTSLVSTGSKITLECCCCFQTYQSLNDFELHVKDKHQNFTVTESSNISKTRNASTGEDKNDSRTIGFIICELCDVQFLNMRDYLKHIQQKHQKRRTPSSNKINHKTRKRRRISSCCDDNEDNLEYKITVYPPTGSPVEIRHNDVTSNNEDDESTTMKTRPMDNRHQCNICDKSFESSNFLQEHMLFSHRNTLSNDQEDDPEPIIKIENQLDSSWRKSFNKGSNLADLTNNKQINVRPIRSGKKQWHCPNCPESFDSIGTCIRHRYYAHDDESVIHICENCSKVLTSVAMVNMHVCRDVFTWECKRCDMHFSNSIELRAHNNNRHLEIVGPHTCTTCKCNFLTDCMMNRHISETHQRYKHERTSTPELIDILTLGDLNDDQAEFIDDKTKSDNSIYSQLITTEKIKCSLCEFICDKRKNIKLHLLGKHKMDVEICELCEELFLKGTLNEHLINDHFVHDEKHRDNETYDFFDILGHKRILSLCGYYTYTNLKTNYHVECLICDRNFKNCSSFKLHNLWVHDNMCSICNMEFDDAHHAANHKLEVHKSIKTYFWLSEHIISSILKQQMYEDAIRGILSSIYSIVEDEQGLNEECDDANDLNDSQSEMLEPEFLDDFFEHNNYSVINQQDFIEDGNKESYDLDAKEDDVILIITQEDLELYKNDIKSLVNQLSSTSKFSEEYLVQLLTEYMKHDDNISV